MNAVDQDILTFWEVYVRLQADAGQTSLPFIMQKGLPRLFEHCFKNSRVSQEHKQHMATLAQLESVRATLVTGSMEFIAHQQKCDAQALVVKECSQKLQQRYAAVSQHLMAMAPTLEAHAAATLAQRTAAMLAQRTGALAETLSTQPEVPPEDSTPLAAAPSAGVDVIAIGDRLARLLVLNAAKAVALVYDKFQGM